MDPDGVSLCQTEESFLEQNGVSDMRWVFMKSLNLIYIRGCFLYTVNKTFLNIQTKHTYHKLNDDICKNEQHIDVSNELE